MTDPHHRPLGNLMDNRVVHRIFGAGTASGWTACGQLIVHFASGITKHLSPLELSTTMVEPPQAVTTPFAQRVAFGWVAAFPVERRAKWFLTKGKALRAVGRI